MKNRASFLTLFFCTRSDGFLIPDLLSTPSPTIFVPSRATTYVGLDSGLSTSTVGDLTEKQTQNKSHKRRTNLKGKVDSEHKWLNWIYKQWSVCEVGKLDEKMLKNMVVAISQWGRRKEVDAAHRAVELLERIVEENLAGNPYATLNVTTFNAAMQGFAKQGAPDEVQRVLRKMETLRTKHSHLAHLRPDVFSMSTLATAWAKSRSPEAAVKAESILNYMDVQKMSPNTITYNAVLNALALGTQVDKGIRAEDIVKRMLERSKAGEDCKPDLYSYQSLIQAWAKTSLPGSPQTAEQILRIMDEEAEKGNKGISPNVYCFTTTIHAWAKSSERKRARSAYELLQHMRKRYNEQFAKKVKPNVVAFTAVLNACSYPIDDSERAESFEIAQLTMGELSLGIYDKPNFLSYAAFLSVCASCLDAGEYRDSVVEKTFKECAQAGQVGNIVIRKLEEAASSRLFFELMGKYVNADGSFLLPSCWTRCIQGERKDGVVVKTRMKSVEVSNAVKNRLKAVGRHEGQSGHFSSGTAPLRLESQGISFSVMPMGS